MAIAKINFFPEQEGENILLKSTLDMENSNLDEVIEAWSKKAMQVANEIKEKDVKFDHDLWMIDQGVTLIIANEEGYFDDKGLIEEYNEMIEEVYIDGNPMKISLKLDITKNSKLIGGLSTPSYQTAMIVAESLETMLKRVSM